MLRTLARRRLRLARDAGRGRGTRIHRRPPDDQIELTGLHAKLFLFEHEKEARLFLGSANATRAAFHDNAEVLVELVGTGQGMRNRRRSWVLRTTHNKRRSGRCCRSTTPPNARTRKHPRVLSRSRPSAWRASSAPLG